MIVDGNPFAPTSDTETSQKPDQGFQRAHAVVRSPKHRRVRRKTAPGPIGFIVHECWRAATARGSPHPQIFQVLVLDGEAIAAKSR